MTAATETYELHHAETNEKLETREIQAEMTRQDEQAATPAELAAMERGLKAGIAEFRAELDAIRKSGILDLHMPDGREARRRREVLAPLAQPRWVPQVPSILTQSPADQWIEQGPAPGAAMAGRTPQYEAELDETEATVHDGLKKADERVDAKQRWRRFTSAVGDALAWAGRA